MNTSKKTQGRDLKPHLPSLEKIQQELGKAQSVDDFFGKQGIFARLFSETIETMLEAELTEHLGYERYEAKRRNYSVEVSADTISAIAVRSWENNWEDLATFFAYPAEIRRLIYTTNAIEGYNRGLRKVVKTKASFPTPEAARKLLYLANQNITKKWTMPMQNWANILN